MTAPRPRRAVAAVALAALFLLAVIPSAVVAHAALDTVTPADKSTVSAPSQIVMTFTEALDPSASNIRLVDASGAVVAQGGTVSASNPKQLTLALSDLAPGAYTIRWTSKSAADGDLARGSTTFTATAATPAAPSAAPSAEASAASAAPSVSASPSTAPNDSPLASSGGTATSSSSTDAVIPIVVAIVALGGLGAWLLRRRSRAA